MKVEDLDNDPLYQAQKSFKRFKCWIAVEHNNIIITFDDMSEYKKAERLGYIHGTFDMYNGNVYTVSHKIGKK